MTLLQNSSIFDTVDIKNNLQKASQSMNSTVANLTDQVVNPFKSLSAGIQAGVATVSETQQVISKTLSTYKSSAIDGINNALKNITGGKYNLGDLGSLVTYQDGFKLNTDQLLSLAGKGIGFNISSMQDLKNQIGNGFINELNSMTGGIASGLVIADTSGGFVKLHIADDWKYSMGTSLINFLGADDPDGFGSVVNVAAINATLNTLLNQAVQNSLTRSYANFKNMYVYESDYHDALITNASVASDRGDLDSLVSMIDIVGTEGAAKIEALYPNTVEELLTAFYFTSDVDPSDYPTLTQNLLKVCVSLKGESWYKYPTQFGEAINVNLVNSISPDARVLLEGVDDLIPLLCSAGIFVEQSATDLFLSDFPTAVKLSS
jgi:hypothetical protein